MAGRSLGDGRIPAGQTGLLVRSEFQSFEQGAFKTTVGELAKDWQQWLAADKIEVVEKSGHSLQNNRPDVVADGTEELPLIGQVTGKQPQPFPPHHVNLKRLSPLFEEEMTQINPFVGRWRIIEMEMWDQDEIDSDVPRYIQIDANGIG